MVGRILLAVALVGVGLLGVVMLGPVGTTAAPAFPACNRVDPGDHRLVKTGRKLFKSDDAFSQDGPFRACATCHAKSDRFTDNRSHLVSPTGDPSDAVLRSTPSLLRNLERTGPYLWDGRAPCLQRQAFGAITSRLEMGGRLPPGAEGQAQLDAITAYVLSLKPPKPLRNLDQGAVARGRQVFSSKPCATCHSGPELTDNRFHDLGIGGRDPGAELVGTGGRGEFNTPSLIGVRVSAPYFHDGRNGVPEGSPARVETGTREALGQVVEFYDRTRGLDLTEQQKRDLVEFLMSL